MLESDTRIQCFKSTLVVIIVGTVVGYSHFLNLATSILFYSPGLGWIFDPDLVAAFGFWARSSTLAPSKKYCCGTLSERRTYFTAAAARVPTPCTTQSG